VGNKWRLGWRLTIEFPMGIINNQPNVEDKKIGINAQNLTGFNLGREEKL
jgi:hypothetical protein